MMKSSKLLSLSQVSITFPPTSELQAMDLLSFLQQCTTFSTHANQTLNWERKIAFSGVPTLKLKVFYFAKIPNLTPHYQKSTHWQNCVDWLKFKSTTAEMAAQRVHCKAIHRE